MRVLFVFPFVLGIGALVQGKDIDVGVGALVVGVVCQLGLHRLICAAPRAYAAHANGLVVTYAAGPRFIPWADVTAIRLAWRSNGTVRLAVYEIDCGAPKPLPVVPANEGAEPVEQFLNQVGRLAGLRWVSEHAATRPRAAVA